MPSEAGAERMVWQAVLTCMMFEIETENHAAETVHGKRWPLKAARCDVLMGEAKNVLFSDIFAVCRFEVGHRLAILLRVFSNTHEIEAIKVFDKVVLGEPVIKIEGCSEVSRDQIAVVIGAVCDMGCGSGGRKSSSVLRSSKTRA